MSLLQATEDRLYPESRPLSTGYKTIRSAEGTQELYYEDYGNPKGELAIVLHGGPGYGTSSFYHRYFDPKKYHVVVFDQRNAKRSRPLATQDNTLATVTSRGMMEDINGLAEAFGVDFSKGEKFHLMGGSWGSLLGLYYGAHYPERLHSLSVRATTLGVYDELNKMHGLEADGVTPRLKAMAEQQGRWEYCAPQWNRFIATIRKYEPELAKSDPVLAYHHALNNKTLSAEQTLEVAHEWVMFEQVIGDVAHTPEEVEQDVWDSMPPEHQISYATIENNWLVQLGKGTRDFFSKVGDPHYNWFDDPKGVEHADGSRTNAWDGLAKLNMLRVVHGKKDVVCFPGDTDILETRMKEAMLRRGSAPEQQARLLKIVRPENSGHMIDDPGITDALVGFSDEAIHLREREGRVNSAGKAGLPDH